MTSGTIRVTSVCMRSVVGDIEGNLRSMLSHIRGSRTLGSDLVLFPELSLTGYSMPSSADHPLPIDSPYIGSIVDAAADHDVIVCFGYVDDRGHISQVVTEKGRISGIYHKTHLGRRESEVMTPGDSLDVIHTSKTGLGIQLCWESHFPDITRTYAMRGAEVILMPHASPLSGYRRGSVWSRILPARCNDNTVFAVACNASGDNGRGTVLGGGAMSFGPGGEVIGACLDDSCTLTVDLDVDGLRQQRGSGGTSMRDMCYLDRRRPELYEP